MNYNLKGTEVSVTDELRTYVEKKLAALDKLLVRSDAARVDIVLSYLESEERQYHAEMTLHDAKHPLHVESYGRTLYEVIDAASGELVDELAKAKKKRHSNWREGSGKIKEFIRGWRNSI